MSCVSQERIASAIFASASMMNHSCAPSVTNSFVGDTLVVRTIRDVEKGAQIYNCYGQGA